MQRPVFVANWKMNLAPSEAREYIAAFAARYAPRSDRTVIICPPAISMTAVCETLGARADIAVGAQNIWTEDRGAFTGETAAPMVRDAGARYVLVGHSERRHVFGETEPETAGKCAAAVRNSLIPILCVGELLSERASGATVDVVLRQLRAGIAQLEASAIASMAIAYEPVWAIGTGHTATPSDASAVHAEIRTCLAASVPNGGEVPILYGGSVNAGNAASLLAAEGVDGLLVGGASLDADGWASICET